MTSPAISVGPEASLKDVARLLVENRITGVPVVADGRVVGIVSQTDIVSCEQQAEAESVRTIRLGRLRRKRETASHEVRTACDAMTSPVATIDSHASAVGAAWTMTARDVNRLPVIEGDTLVGMVTRTDVVRAFGRPDVEIRGEIVGEVLPALLASDNDVTVTVDEGVVRLHGEVEDEVEVRCLPHAVRGVLGVVDVVAELVPRHSHTAFDRASALL